MIYDTYLQKTAVCYCKPLHTSYPHKPLHYCQPFTIRVKCKYLPAKNPTIFLTILPDFTFQGIQRQTSPQWSNARGFIHRLRKLELHTYIHTKQYHMKVLRKSFQKKSHRFSLGLIHRLKHCSIVFI